MKYLADTHILIWALEDNPQLSEKARNIILDEQSDIYFSFPNIWEVAIKHALQKEDIPFSAKDFEKLCDGAGFLPLRTTFEHAYIVETLQYDRESAPRDHRDPFDRLLIAQAKTENMLFLTHDELVPYYHEECVLSV